MEKIVPNLLRLDVSMQQLYAYHLVNIYVAESFAVINLIMLSVDSSV